MSLPVFVVSCSGGTVRDHVVRQLVRGSDAGRVAAIVPGRRRSQRRSRAPSGVTLVPTRERLVRMGQGCACCTVRADLLGKVRDIAGKGEADQLLIHLPPHGDLDVLAKTFSVPDAKGAVLEDEAHFNQLIVVVHLTELVEATRAGPAHPLVARIELAQVVLLDAGGGAGGDLMREARLLLRAVNPDARIIDLDSDQATLTELRAEGVFDMDAAKQRAEPQGLLERGGANEDGSIRRAAFRARRPFHPQRFYDWVAGGQAGLVRAKGTFWVASRPHLAATLDVALGGRRTDVLGHWWAAVPEAQRPQGTAFAAHLRQLWDPVFGDRRQDLVFVGIDIDESMLLQSLQACLLTDDELADPERWSSGPHPFPWAAEDA